MSALIRFVGNLGEALSRFSQRWIPDSWGVCMMLTVMAILLAIVGAGAGLNETVLAWGGGMWSLLELAMQVTIAMIADARKSSGMAGTTLGTSAMTFASLPYRPATVMAWPAFKAVSTWVNRLVTETCMISRNGPG